MHPLDMAFWFCLMLGGVYTLVSLVLSGASQVVDHGADAGSAHSIGHAEAGVGAADAHGHVPATDPGEALAHHGSHGATQAHHEGGFNLLQYVSPLAVAGFLLGFGGVGVAARMMGLAVWPSLVCATAGGLGLWLIAYLIITRIFVQATGTSHYRQDELVGRRGLVLASIEGRRPGMVCYTITGSRQTVRAVSEDPDEALPAGTAVRIRRMENNTAFVSKIDL
ncbi:MAG TPA: NfeD family protein [Chthonomonadales bacterium]|nr:NfeD family protein [Chthonomonadales bacterium]